MELALDKNIAIFLGIVGAVFLVAIVIPIIVPAVENATRPYVPPKYNFTAQLEFMNYTICAQTDAYQMFMQNPTSSHPNVLKLVKEMGMYNSIAEEVRKSGVKAENFSKC